MVFSLSYRKIRSLLGALVLTAFGCGLSCSSGCGRIESLEAPWPLPTTHQPQQPPAGQWVGHRGAALHGVADAAPLPSHFGPETNLRWCVNLPGKGNSSPAVFGDRVFLTAECPGQPPELSVLCLNRLNGDIEWQQSVGTPTGATHHKNGYATATAATDGERVYATFGARGVFCFSVDGQPLWHVPLDHLEHTWGHASSPVLSGDLVIQLADGARGSHLIAMNCYTGEIVWSTQRESSGSWTTPVLVSARVEGKTRWEIVVNGTGSTNGAAGFVIAYDVATGQELWHVQGTTDIPCPTAIVGDNLLISTSGMNGPIIAIRPGGTGDTSTSHIAWRLPWGGPYVPTGITQDGLLYLISDGGILRCLDMHDGQQRWEKRLQGSFSASLVAGDGKLFAVSEGGSVHVFALRERCELLAVNHLRQPCLATPAIAQGDLYVRTARQLCCFAETQSADPVQGIIAHDSGSPIIPVSATQQTSVSTSQQSVD